MNMITYLLAIFAIGARLFGPALGFADERIWLKDAMIDGKSVKLCFDSGSNINAISPQAAKRLGLKVNVVPTNGLSPGFVGGVTDRCTLTLNGIQAQTVFTVVNFPDYLNVDSDGLIGREYERRACFARAWGECQAALERTPRSSHHLGFGIAFLERLIRESDATLVAEGLNRLEIKANLAQLASRRAQLCCPE